MPVDKNNLEISLSKDTFSLEELLKLDGEIDQLFGLSNIEEIEQSLSQAPPLGNNLYLENLSASTLNTSYIDLYLILKELSKTKKATTVCDLGAAYGRMALLAERFFPTITVVSIEPLAARLEAASKLLCNTRHSFHFKYFKEVSSALLCDTVFFYFPTGKVFDEILIQVRDNQTIKSIIAIESHGELINRLKIETSWLRPKKLTLLKCPRHNSYSYLFSRKRAGMLSTLERLNNKLLLLKNEEELMIRDKGRHWLANTKGLEIHYDNDKYITLEFRSPPRTSYLKHSCEVEVFSTDDELLLSIIAAKNSMLLINGFFIRKIYPYESELELSNGQIVSFAHYKNIVTPN